MRPARAGVRPAPPRPPRLGLPSYIATLTTVIACGGEETTAPPPPPPPPVAPTAVGSMPDQAIEAGGTVTVDAAEYFRDPHGGALTYAAESSAAAVASVETSGSSVTVTGTGPGTATVTVTATDPDNLSATQSFGVVVSGTVADDFDSDASLNDWEGDNADLAVTDGALNLTNRTGGLLGIAERRGMPSLNDWTIQARMGRTTRKASPGVVSLTRHGRFTAVRLVLRTLDEDDADRDRAADATSTTASRNYEFAVFDGDAGEWVLVTNLSGGSESVVEEPGAFTEIALGHEGGDFVGYAGEDGAAELFRFDLATTSLEGVALGEIVSDVTGFWLVNQGSVGLTALHDWARVTGTGSGAPPSDGAGIADAPDAATRSVSVAGPDADRAALEALYRATDGPNWVNNDNWLTDAPLGEWYGVDTDDEGRVVSIKLAEFDLDTGFRAGNGLSGPLPPEIGDLANLEFLSLGENGITGPIPPELGDLANLEFLWLGHNGLTGPIPPELGNLTNLTLLDVSVNDFSGSIPPEIGNLANLRTLNIWGSNLSGPIPPELGGLSELEYLVLANSALSGTIPPELGNLTHLRRLWLSLNDLTGEVPPELGNLANLGSLVLEQNPNLRGRLPATFPAGLTTLDTLLLYDTGVCVPRTDAFQAFLSSLLLWTGSTCAGSAMAVPPDTVSDASELRRPPSKAVLPWRGRTEPIRLTGAAQHDRGRRRLGCEPVPPHSLANGLSTDPGDPLGGCAR